MDDRHSQLVCWVLVAALVRTLLLDVDAGATSFCHQPGLEAASAVLGLVETVRDLGTLAGMLGLAWGSQSGGWCTSPTTFTLCPSGWKLWMELSKHGLRSARGILSPGWGCCS